jgi:hypothetical protein
MIVQLLMISERLAATSVIDMPGCSGVKAAMTRGAKYLPVETTPSLIVPAATPCAPDGFLERGHLVDNATRGFDGDLADLGRLRAGLGTQEKLAAEAPVPVAATAASRQGDVSPSDFAAAEILPCRLDGEQRSHCRIETLSMKQCKLFLYKLSIS